MYNVARWRFSMDYTCSLNCNLGHMAISNRHLYIWFDLYANICYRYCRTLQFAKAKQSKTRRKRNQARLFSYICNYVWISVDIWYGYWQICTDPMTVFIFSLHSEWFRLFGRFNLQIGPDWDMHSNVIRHMDNVDPTMGPRHICICSYSI